MVKSAKLAKLSRPRLYDALARERLFRLLDVKRKHPAVWVCGPPGAGKTTLVASYLEAAKLGSVWYQADAGDLDPATFCYFLGQALPHARGRRRPLPLLTPEYLPDLENFGRRYFREFFSKLADDTLLVIDNFHELAGGDTERLLAQVVEQIPDGATVIFISRGEPPRSFARHLAGALAILDGADLKLTPTEATEIASLRNVDVRIVGQALAQCDGWAAGLTLILERHRRSGELGEIVEADSKEDVFAYFAAQFFDQTSPREQMTLMQIALLPSVATPFAIAVSGDPEAGVLLERLYRRQLFTHRRGGDNPRYQFHGLFREFLLRRFRQTDSEAQRRRFLSHAATLATRHGLTENAFELLCEAEDWQSAGRLVLSHAEDFLRHGRGRTIARWIHGLPAEVVESEPWLRYWLGVATMPDDPTFARSALSESFSGFVAAGNEVGQVLSASAFVETYFGNFSGYAELKQWTGRLGRLLDDHEGDLSKDTLLHAYSSFLLAALCGDPCNPHIVRCAYRLKDLLLEDLEPNLRLKGGACLLTYCTATFDLGLGLDVETALHRVASENRVSPFRLAWWLIRLGSYQFQIGEDDRAFQSFQQAGRIIEEHRFAASDSLRLAWLTWLCAAMGKFTEAAQTAEALSVALKVGRSQGLANLRYAQFVVCGHAGRDPEDCLEHQVASVRHADEAGLTWIRVCHRIALAFALTETGRVDEARFHIGEMRRLMNETCFWRYEAPAQLLEAYLDLRCGKLGSGRERLTRAMRVSREVGYSFEHRTVPRLVADLFAYALEADIEVDFVQSQIRKFKMRPPRDGVRNWPYPLAVRTLGSFELIQNGRVLSFPRKTPRKPLALLKAIVAFGGRLVPEKRIVDVLWPEEEGDAARESYRVALHRLRKILGDPDMLTIENGRVSLDCEKCWVDLHAFERAVGATIDCLRSPAPESDPVLCLYRGPFLPENEESPWAVSARERLRSKFVAYVARQGKRLEASGRHDLAAEYYRRGIEADELAEEFYQGLMRCHLQAGGVSDAMSVYRRLRQTLSVTLGIHPSPASQKLFQSLRQ